MSSAVPVRPNVFQRLLSYSRPYGWRIALAALGSVGVGGMDGAMAYLVEPVLRRIFSGKETAIFVLLPAGIVLLYALRGLCRYTNDYFIRSAGQLAVQDVRNDLYEKNMRLSIGYFHRHETGTLMSRVLSDVSMMQEGVGQVITGLFRDGLSAIALLGVIFYRDWQLALISFVVIPLTVVPARKIGKRIKRVARQGQEKMGDLASILQETYSGIKVVKAFGLEGREIERFRARNRDFYHFTRKNIKYEGLSTPIMEFITSFGIAAVIWVGGSNVMHGTKSASEFFSFITAMVLVFNPIKRLLAAFNNLQRSMGAAERVFEVMDEKPEIVDAPGSRDLGKARGEVEFRDVRFKYEDDYVLQGVNLTAKRGEVIALVGPSGGGKTTLVSLITRFYDPTSGQVLMDGVDIRERTMKSLLEQIALVDQETILFNDTIANNIRYGRMTATDAEVEAAARAAFAHDFIQDLPEGYLTNIGDRGVRLSGGQRQRLCIARAILKDAPILILDEATSALDTESEQMVQKALNNLMQNRTTFVIAHRLSTITHADRIVVLEKGAVAEMGSHDDLLKADGIYSRLHGMQFRA
ncbi:lipid A export permease/ATP-binding protein MsbA [Geomonas sp. Red69]|uniref:Lipid A export permease/ATP-binding protein MsbA n=1 Tax=Geomonas diazotrophica TaxID=2843197 RepID=A0ABX8JHV0_9BACT|nr:MULTISPECIES: lipid A export permease/ATP-binding protein MsbA [Geomonas]MBU5638257.1 lipid A export permease/ATP-binding protein MsbA [Geomonas diazotrophica]QWV96736.1 lipid A export permease/ATP-binding protein MsbA [Geomonas nitrogeniifigens]QXE85839.1 lipid A export permease/ATP-binding protein MsbA [Geomonas nitrogeniifigens]